MLKLNSLTFFVLTFCTFTSCARRVALEGLVVAVRPELGEVVISHKSVDGWMPAMIMPFRVNPQQMAGLYPGARVDFEIGVTKVRTKVRRMKLIESGLDGIKLDDGEALKLPPPDSKVAMRSIVPDFALTDQSGNITSLSSFRGRTVVINFIYTRCPLPEVCPRLSAGFAFLQKKFSQRLGTELILLTVTLDPTYDTVPVLSNYAARWHASKDGWRFLTGTRQQVAKVAGYFGLVYWAEEDSLVHSSVTSILGHDGRLVARVEGSRHSVTQLADLVLNQLDGGKK